MYGLGTLINTGAIILGGFFGHLFGRALKKTHQETLTLVCGVSSMFIGASGALRYMLPLQEAGSASVPDGGSILVVVSLVLGGLIGELLRLEDRITAFGEWLKRKTGNSGEQGFVNGFVTASLTVCIGAMAIVGSIQDGLTGDWSILAAKSLLDLIIVMVMSSSLGKGCVFSAIPVFLLQGGMTLLASALRPLMTDLALAYLSLVGSVLIFCVGVNLVWGKKIRVANLLPALLIALGFSFLPVTF